MTRALSKRSQNLSEINMFLVLNMLFEIDNKTNIRMVAKQKKRWQMADNTKDELR